MTVERFLPFCGRRYWIDDSGVVYSANGVIEVVDIDEMPHVELEWVLGRELYPVGLIIIVCFHGLFLPDYFWLKLIPMKINDSEQWVPDNVVYRFDEPIEVEDFPGYFYVPFFTRYAISKSGQLINADSGTRMTWYVSKPNETKGSAGGYHSARVVRGDGRTAMLFRHRALCLTFKKYPSKVKSMVVNHLDGNQRNDSLENLEWVTYKINNQHAYDNGLRPNASTPILVKDLTTGEIRRFPTIAECARTYPMLTPWTISYRLRKTCSREFSDNLRLKYDDGTDW